MSIFLISAAWRTRLGNAAAKSVLLRLCGFADDDGWNVFPAVPTVARDCDLGERTVQEALRRLEADGLLVLVREADFSRRRPREYRIDVTVLGQMPLAWLLKLAALVAGSKPLSEIEAQSRAYAEMLDYPAFVYSRDTLREAGGERFRFFPALAELRAFFDEKVSAVREEQRRCRLIATADGRTRPADDWRPPTEDEAAGVSRFLDENMGPNWRPKRFP